jgi:hypothetical protein
LSNSVAEASNEVDFKEEEYNGTLLEIGRVLGDLFNKGSSPSEVDNV